MTSASPPLFAPSHLLVGRAVSPGYVSVTTHGLRWVCTLRRSQPFPSFSRLSANVQPTHELFSPQATHLRLRLVVERVIIRGEPWLGRLAHVYSSTR